MTEPCVPREQMEDIAPPEPPRLRDAGIRPATLEECEEIKKSARVRTIESAAAHFVGYCLGGDRYANNCAHFLSDAFIRAGFELPANLYRCGTPSKRAIRARELRKWFKSMATDLRRELPVKEGYWAVFQLDEDAYWGGHVVIIDTDRNLYFGTGHYPHWDQYCYKWQ